MVIIKTDYHCKVRKVKLAYMNISRFTVILGSLHNKTSVYLCKVDVVTSGTRYVGSQVLSLIETTR